MLAASTPRRRRAGSIRSLPAHSPFAHITDPPGGTAFWSLEDAGAERSLAESNPPTRLLAPPAGTALIFGGQLTHAAQPLLTGERVVCVASFSPVARRSAAAFTAALGGAARPAVPEGSPEARRPRAWHAARAQAVAAADECSVDELAQALGLA